MTKIYSEMFGLLLIIIFISWHSLCMAQELEIHHINVGQGDAILIKTPSGQTLLYDAGPAGQGYVKVLPYIVDLGIEKLDYTVVSHYHSPQIGGYQEVIYGLDREPGTSDDLGPLTAAFDRGWSYCGTNYAGYVGAAGAKRQTIAQGQVIHLGNVDVECVAANGVINGTDYRQGDKTATDCGGNYPEDDYSVGLLVE